MINWVQFGGYTNFAKCNVKACEKYLQIDTKMYFRQGTDVLALCGTLTAQEAKRHGLVTEVFPDWNFDNEVGLRLKRY